MLRLVLEGYIMIAMCSFINFNYVSHSRDDGVSDLLGLSLFDNSLNIDLLVARHCFRIPFLRARTAFEVPQPHGGAFSREANWRHLREHKPLSQVSFPLHLLLPWAAAHLCGEHILPRCMAHIPDLFPLLSELRDARLPHGGEAVPLKTHECP